MAENSDPRRAITDMVRCLTGVFDRYSRTARTKAWNALTSSEGQKEVRRLLNSPGATTSRIERLISFKEWMGRDHA